MLEYMGTSVQNTIIHIFKWNSWLHEEDLVGLCIVRKCDLA